MSDANGSTPLPRLPNPEYLTVPSHQVRAQQGRRLREQITLESHASFSADVEGRDALGILEAQATNRMPDLVPIRYGRMASSPFAFLRGSAAVMAADLARTPVSGLEVQLCGDAHLLNFGIFETPERSLVFGLNDFDETIPGPFEWDVKRLAASVEVAGRDLGFSSAKRRKSVTTMVRTYRESMIEFSEMRTIDVWHDRLPVRELQTRLETEGDLSAGKEVRRKVAKALHHDHLHAFDRYLNVDGGALRFVSDPPLIVPVDEILDDQQRERYVEVTQDFLRKYRASLTPDRRRLVESYCYVDMARKVVGVGSVGTSAWVALFVGRDTNDPLMLQIKEAQTSVLAPYLTATIYPTEGQRVVEGQRLLQAAPDHLLGWYELIEWDGVHRHFYVRQLWDGKASIDVTKLSPQGLRAYAKSCGWTLARAHARSGDRFAIAAYLGDDRTFDEAIADFAASYADANVADHAQLVGAIDEGRIEATMGI